MYKLFITYLLMMLVLSFPLQGAAEIYTWTDDAGRIHFTDSPPDKAKSKQVKISPINSYNSPSSESVKNILDRSTGVIARKAKVTLYSTTWCGYCKKARRWFRQNKIPFTEYDTEKSARGRRDYKKMNGRGVPIIKVGKKRLNGFSPSSLTRALRKAGYNI
ncbi:MAG: DUF4124 domain-containing protein [Sulfuriflexus sp.]|nr:DUF4124 domain-containing protein [Sulfuriflexus sp.]